MILVCFLAFCYDSQRVYTWSPGRWYQYFLPNAVRTLAIEDSAFNFGYKFVSENWGKLAKRLLNFKRLRHTSGEIWLAFTGGPYIDHIATRSKNLKIAFLNDIRAHTRAWWIMLFRTVWLQEAFINSRSWKDEESSSWIGVIDRSRRYKTMILQGQLWCSCSTQKQNKKYALLCSLQKVRFVWGIDKSNHKYPSPP